MAGSESFLRQKRRSKVKESLICSVLRKGVVDIPQLFSCASFYAYMIKAPCVCFRIPMVLFCFTTANRPFTYLNDIGLLAGLFVV